MIEVVLSSDFERWIRRLRDRRAVERIVSRLQNLEMGKFGDVAPVGGGVSEMRIHYGPGYRLYFIQSGPAFVVLLCGGDKDSQQRDIRLAQDIAREWR